MGKAIRIGLCGTLLGLLLSAPAPVSADYIEDAGIGTATVAAKRLLAEEPLTLQDIGDQYGISRERVRQLESRLKKKLKEYLLRELPDLTDLNVGLAERG